MSDQSNNRFYREPDIIDTAAQPAAWVSEHDLATAQRYGIANATLYRKQEQNANTPLMRGAVAGNGKALYERLQSLMPEDYPDEWADLLEKYQHSFNEAAIAPSVADAAGAIEMAFEEGRKVGRLLTFEQRAALENVVLYYERQGVADAECLRELLGSKHE
ncbi:hypothetical protein [Caballeronia sp. S22]|uniref:hypothetical protein n=1 Tax=Caballeronia sp. S22 TaxID=3137182 RepID=UPI0035312031